ncbi:MAG: hypothetical protein IKN54_02340 [Lachnospiraceae bacterium]|nr:hypothetical protein [Lachnospiraceae bacterium]
MTVMVTVLVVTQVIRVIQNAIHLHRQKIVYREEERDIKTQRDVNNMMYAKLMTEMRYVREWREEYEKYVNSQSDEKRDNEL